MALRITAPCRSAQKLLVKQRMKEREGQEYIPGRVIWDELTETGPANWEIEPPAPMKGPLGWKLWFHERNLQDASKTYDQGVFAMKVNAAIQEEFAKIEAHVPPVESHHRPGGKVLVPFQFIESEKRPQTASSIPKDKYELERFIADKKAYHDSELFSITANYAWQRQQARRYRADYAGSLSEDARVVDEAQDEDDAGRLFGGQIAQSFIIGWLTLLFISLIWRVK